MIDEQSSYPNESIFRRNVKERPPRRVPVVPRLELVKSVYLSANFEMYISEVLFLISEVQMSLVKNENSKE